MVSRDHEWSEHLDGFSTHYGYPKLDLFTSPGHDDFPTILWEVCQVPVLLVIIGILSALVSYALSRLVDLGIEHLWVTGANIEDKHGWMLFCLWSVMFALLSCFFTRTICREAAGSGLPEMKTILGGTIKPVLLSFRLVLAKVGGLALALIAGLSVGKEGPLVQVSGALADQVMRLPLFRNVYRQDARRLEIIACACASGVAATFGTSYGSVLFSIELTSSAYLVRTLPKAFLASVFAMLVFFVLGVSDQLALFNEEIQSESFAPRWNELVAFLLIGVLSGLLGAVFVFLVEFLSKFRNRILDTKKYSLSVTAFRSYALVACIAGVTAWFRYYEWATVPQTGHGIRTLYDYLFQKNDMAPILGHLSVYFLYKFFATAFSVTLPLPVGLFTPIFLTGGVMGRIIGEILTRYRGFEHYFPWEYSVLGAAGLATGVTRAMSTAVIVYELAGQPHLRLPLAIVVITAYFVGNRLSKMVYEVLIDTNGTPYVQDVPRQLYHVPVATVMLPIHSVHVLALDSTYEEAEQLLEATKVDETHFLPPLLHHFSPRSRAAPQHQQHASLPEQGLSVEQPYLVEMSPLLTASTQSRASYTLQLDMNYLSNTNSTTTASAQQSPDENLTPHRCIKITNYAPKVIPVVKSRRNMVIVGAVLRTDVEKAVSDMRRVLEIANTPPVVLGRYEDVSFNEDFAAGSDSDDDSEPATPNSAASTKASRRVNFSEKSQAINEQQQQQHRLHISPNRHRGAHSTNHAQSLMLQTIQYVVVTNGGRSVIPVATNRHGTVVSASPVSYHTLSLVVPIDPSPYQIVDTMQLSKVDLLFRMLSLNQAYVTHSGKLVGLVTRGSLRECLGHFSKRPLDRLAQMGHACWVAMDQLFCNNSSSNNINKASNGDSDIRYSSSTIDHRHPISTTTYANWREHPYHRIFSPSHPPNGIMPSHPNTNSSLYQTQDAEESPEKPVISSPSPIKQSGYDSLGDKHDLANRGDSENCNSNMV